MQISKNIMQGKLIGVAYTLRTYRNQFSLSGICKQVWVPQCSFSIRRVYKHRILLILIIHILVFYDQNISLIIYVKDGSHVRLRHPSSVYITAKRQYTACSTKDAYTSEITFLALNPCKYLILHEIIHKL